jgi:hypothetical protein
VLSEYFEDAIERVFVVFIPPSKLIVSVIVNKSESKRGYLRVHHAEPLQLMEVTLLDQLNLIEELLHLLEEGSVS